MTRAISPASGVAVQAGAGGVQVSFHGVQGWLYQVEASESLQDLIWRKVGSQIAGDNGTITVDDSAAASLDRCFYRIVTTEP